jgi:hypothetical protein
MLATTIHKSNTTPHHQSRATTTTPDQRRAPPPKRRSPLPVPQNTGQRSDAGLLSQSPIVCSVNSRRPAPPKRQPRKNRHVCCAPEPHPLQMQPIQRIAQLTEPPHCCGRGMSLVVLLRKEVIQPHLPVRLPCYDFVPIADPTFDRSLPYGLGHGLRVLPTFMT